MAKPRIFVSSTYYDLKHIRNSLESFISGFGYESVLFEDGDIVFKHDKPLDQSCYEEILNCHMFVLIIGGRYGSPTSAPEDETDEQISKNIEIFNSVTKKEYETAREKDLPIYIFIEKGVLSEFQTYKKNRDKKDIEYAHVDNINIFRLIEEIYSQRRNNLVKDFDRFDDIANWLKEQWAGLFADMLSSKNSESELSDLSSQIEGLREVSSVLREYSESMMLKIDPDNFQQIIDLQNQKLLDRRLQRFENEDFIKYLMDRRPKGVGIKTLFNAFTESETVEAFLENSKFDADFIEDLMSRKGDLALRDFKKFKKEY